MIGETAAPQPQLQPLFRQNSTFIGSAAQQQMQQIHPLARRSSCQPAKAQYEEQSLPQTGLDTSDMKKLTDLAQLISSEQLTNQNPLVASLNAAQQRQILNV